MSLWGNFLALANTFPNSGTSSPAAVQVKEKRTEPTLCPSGWYTPLTLNLEEGILDQVLRPCSSNFHSFCGFVASPENLHPMPTVAIGVGVQA
jgi:hypothetical protein